MGAATLVLGLGNLLRGDDGVGPRIVQELGHYDLPEGAATLDGGTGGLDLLRVIEDWDRVVIIDAADLGREPGHYVRFTPDQVRLTGTSDTLSLHNAGLREALALAEALELDLPEMVVFGVQPADVGWNQGLSPAVASCLKALTDAVLEEIKGEDHAQDPGN